MTWRSTDVQEARTWCAGLLLCLSLTACERNDLHQTYTEQLAVCDLAQDNGLLDEAVVHCTAAIDALRDTGDASERIGALALRLAVLERQRSQFEEALAWLSAAERDGVAEPATLGLERALVLAGQERWEDGVELLQELLPDCLNLNGEARATARTTYAGYARRLELQGNEDTSAWFKAAAESLAADATAPPQETASS